MISSHSEGVGPKTLGISSPFLKLDDRGFQGCHSGQLFHGLHLTGRTSSIFQSFPAPDDWLTTGPRAKLGNSLSSSEENEGGQGGGKADGREEKSKRKKEQEKAKKKRKDIDAKLLSDLRRVTNPLCSLGNDYIATWSTLQENWESNELRSMKMLSKIHCKQNIV